MASDCKRDPNVRTTPHQIENELLRIARFKDYKKLNADTFHFTTRMFELFMKEKMLVVREETLNSLESPSPTFENLKSSQNFGI